MKKLLLIFTFVLALFSIHFAQHTVEKRNPDVFGKGSKTVKKENKAVSQVSTKVLAPTKFPVKTVSQENLPQLPAELFQRLWDSCTLVDYTFLTMPFTISLDRKPSIQSSLRHIGGGVAVRIADCKVFAKLFFQIKGEIIMDADLFYTDNGCTYFVYNIKGKPTYANPISAEGIQFLTQIIDRQKSKKN